MKDSSRERFLSYVRARGRTRPVVSPFLPDPGVVKASLVWSGLPATDDPVQDEIRLARALDYEPMFMTDCMGLIFPWRLDEDASDEEVEVSVIELRRGTWVRRVSRQLGLRGDTAGFPVKTVPDHQMVIAACEEIGSRADKIRAYFREWRQRVGEDGVIVIGHPHLSWLGDQISPENIFLHWHDSQETFRRSMDAIFQASLFVMEIAMAEGIDFMSESSYGLEMTSPALFGAIDMPYIQAFADWTHRRGGLFWYHNCGQTRKLIMGNTFNRMGADLIETIAPPPDGDNDLGESRRFIAPHICTKGNLNLGLLHDGNPEQVAEATRRMVAAVQGYAHIFSTADAVLPGTPPENLVAFLQTARQATEH